MIAAGKALSVFLGLRTKAEDVTVGILHLHLEGPRLVGWLLPDDDAAVLVCDVQRPDIADADPDPCAYVSLAASAEVAPSPTEPDIGEVVVTPRCFLTSKNAHCSERSPACLRRAE